MRVECLGGPMHGGAVSVGDPPPLTYFVPIPDPRPFSWHDLSEVSAPSEIRTVAYALRRRRADGRSVYVAPDYDPTTLRIEQVLSQMQAESDSERLSTDATATGIGDPLADVLRNIDELLEGQ